MKYDPSVQMFVDEPREPDLEQLRFMRWLVTEGRLETVAYGLPSGEYAAREGER